MQRESDIATIDVRTIVDVQDLLHIGQERGYVTSDEIMALVEEHDMAMEEIEDFYSELQSKAGEAMSKMAGPLEKAGVSVREVVIYGPRAERVVEFAEQESVDLIILNSHRVDPENPGLGWATLSYKVAILSQCPVLLVK